MFQLNKQSNLVTVSSDIKLADIKKQLADEGSYFGYYPLEDIHLSINHYLKRRIINLYHFKYGSLPELVSSFICELENGKSFHLKDAPRAAIGPDFNRMVLGSKNVFGSIKTVTLKICPMPEKITHGIIPVKSRDHAKKIISQLVGEFVFPLYFRLFDLDKSTSFMKELKVKSKKSECLLVCFSGLNEMVSVQQEIVSAYCHAGNMTCHWIQTKQGRDIINNHLHNHDSYRDIKEQYRNFLWPASDHNAQMMLEKEFLNV